MFSLLCAVAFVSPEPLLAFTARIYNAPSDKRTSSYQVYVSDLHGGHRRQLTHSKNGAISVGWLGNNALAWVQQDGTLWTSKLRPWSPRKIADSGFEFLNNVSQYGMPRGQILAGTGKEITLSGINTRRGEPSWATPGGTDDPSKVWQVPGGESVVAGYDQPSVAIGDKVFKMPEEVANTYPIRWTGKTLWVRGENYAGMHGRDDAVFTLETTAGKWTKKVDWLGYLDWDYTSPWYAGMTDGGHGLIPYGKNRNVDGAKLYAGNWKTGKRWLVLGGVVHVTCVSVQPEGARASRP